MSRSGRGQPNKALIVWPVTYGVPAIFADGAPTLADFVSTATGSETVGTSAQTLAAFTSSATGGYGPNGTSSQTLADFTSSASGGLGPTGTSAQTLTAFTSAVTAGTGPNGTSAQTLAAFTAVGTGSEVVGTSSQVLADFVSAGTSGFGPNGTSTQTIADFASAAVGASSGTPTTTVDHPYGGIRGPLFTPHPRPAPTQPKSKPVPVLPALVYGSARLSLAALSSTADGFYDIGPVIEADDEDFLLNFLETV